MTVEIDGVTLHLAHPDELTIQWVGQDELMRQLLAAWMVVNEQDRHVLASVFGQDPLDVRFAESCEEAYSVTNQLTAPVILLDRDWPGTEWKAAVERLKF